jgi:uncharacterized protein
MRLVDRAGFNHGMRLFNAAEFYDAHEVWEDVWRPLEPSPERQLLQGLIQIAVGLHHHGTGNNAGALSLLKRGGRNVRKCRAGSANIDIDEFLRQVNTWHEALSAGSPLPALPKIANRADKKTV